ncbi:ulp1 protease family, C-terminal catalytic domain-containing protein [Artemisia annua]|uniref:Ulp1 protease family, C-terminal catalytic domain-containing protein n=1 Tax=Artemisia annua TaxID=35608 RepID=A0A2U1Q0U4_ARTAN|nr:ulp1 protease family, C-terminal catalytic domain-containing protein [Artemisia annua]
MMITDDATVTEQLPQPESEIHEPTIMAGPKDDVRVVQEVPQYYTEPKADLSEQDVNAHPEAEVLVAAASASPTNSNLSSSEDDEAVNADSHEDPRLYQRSLSTCSDTAKDDGVFCGPSSDHCTSEFEMDDEEVTTVVFSPDHMAYQDRYCIDCVLTFTSSCIKIEGSFLDNDEEPFRLQWGIEDILYIKSHWYQHAGMTMLKIRVLMEDTLQAENVECPSGTELRFAFIGANWYGKQEAVTSLNDTYKTLWTGIDESGDTVHGHTQASFPKYFPCFDQPFEEVIYPKGEVDAVSIGKRDVDMLLPDTFVNDTIIDFYIKYLKNKINPEDRPRFHFLNSFFFRKLADPDKEPLEACKGKEAFQRVRKWTRKVNLFEKDYVFIPVNFNYHWSLIVMCHLGEVATYQDEDVTKLSKVPCVLHMDPIRGNHTGLNGLMQSYLKEEWRGRVPETSEDICSRFDNLRFISLELPQQPNSYDCGLFLLHYVELFLEQAPINFNPFKISQSVDFLNMDWFPPADASLKRVVIQRLVYDLLEAPSPVHANDDNFHIETAVNFFPETFNNNPSTVCQTSHDDDEIEISLLPSLTMTTEPCPVGPTESLKPTFEPRSFLSMQFPSFNEATFDGYKSSLAPSLEGNIENGGQSVYSLTEIDLEQDNGIAPEIPYSSQDLRNGNFYETSPQTSISGCEDSLEVVNSNKQMNEEVDFMELRHEPRSPLMEHVEIPDDNDNGNGYAYNLTLSSQFFRNASKWVHWFR